MKKKDRIKLLKEEQASAHKVNLELLSRVQELKNSVNESHKIIDGRNEVIQEAVVLFENIIFSLNSLTQAQMMKKYGVLIGDFIRENSIAEVDFEEPKEEWEPFDADKWTPDRVVKTVDGRGVRVLCVDGKNPYPVVVLVAMLGGESTQHYCRNGKYFFGALNNDDCLMMLKEKHIEEPG